MNIGNHEHMMRVVARDRHERGHAALRGSAEIFTTSPASPEAARFLEGALSWQ
jgi:hypothetical protein